MRFLFTAAPHDRIKHLRVSSTPSANAETPKKQHSGGGNLVGEGGSFFCVRSGTFNFYVWLINTGFMTCDGRGTLA